MPEDTKQHFDEFKGKFLCDNGYDLIQAIKDSEPLERELDKIRAEIEQMDFDFGDFYDHTSTIREMVLAVIDKYKRKSEK